MVGLTFGIVYHVQWYLGWWESLCYFTVLESRPRALHVLGHSVTIE